MKHSHMLLYMVVFGLAFLMSYVSGIEYKSDKAPVVAGIKAPERLYFVAVTSVYDGDTFTGDIDLGLDVVLKDQKFRLKDINTPELRGADKEAGIVERDKLREQINKRKVIVQINGKGKYGRWITVIKGVIE